MRSLWWLQRLVYKACNVHQSINNPTSVLYMEVGPPLLNQVRYHLPITGVLNHPTIVNASFKRKIFLYDKGDYESYRNILSVVDWDGIFRNDDIDIITNTITNTILDAANKTIPNRYITVKKDNPPWITTKIKKYICRKNRIHKKAKKTNTIGQWEKFRKIRNKFNKLILNAKQSYFDKISEKINTETNGSKNWWKLVKSILHSDSGGDRSIPPLQVENDMIQDDNKKAELFNDYFCKQADLNDSETSVPDITDILINGLEQITVTENEVEDILKILDTSKAIGPDLLNPRLLKEAASILKYPLCTLFNLSLTLSTFPSEWKYANVTPVFKKDCPSNLKNYRPISLISILAKVMERLVYKHIYNYLIDNNLITSHQSGFTPGDSAVNQLLYITNEFGRTLDEGKEVRVVFCDISKAFDRVWHKGLLRKLESIGIRGSLLSWVKNYFSERKQRVVINNSTSSWHDINAGVPQGSILGLLLFIVFINDILTDINSTIKLFADDTSLYLIVDDPQETAQTLNDDLVKLHAWSTKWLVNFNPQKTETMTISWKLNKPNQPNLIMNNTIISTVTEHKHLGLQLSDDGNWNKHIDMITKKAFSRVNILRKFKFILDRKTLETIYITFIRPLLEYADVVWDTKTQILINKLENVQVEAARIVTGGTRLVSLSNLYIETGWEKLKDRRERHRTIQFYKMSNNLTPQYLSNLIPQNFGMIHDHNTRHTSRIPPVRTRTSLYAPVYNYGTNSQKILNQADLFR